MKATKITATELARNLSDILNRVRYQGECFEVQKHGNVVAELRPSLEERSVTAAEFFRRAGDLKVPEGLGEDLAKLKEEQPPMPEPPIWPD